MIEISRIEGLTRTMMMMVLLMLLCEMKKISDVRMKMCCHLKYFGNHCSCCCCCCKYCCCCCLALYFREYRNDLGFGCGDRDQFHCLSQSRLSVYQEIYYFLLSLFPFQIQYQLNGHQYYHYRHLRSQIMMWTLDLFYYHSLNLNYNCTQHLS